MKVSDSQVTSLDLRHNVNECVVHQVMWGWSLFMMVCTPYAFVVLRNLRRVAAGKYQYPKSWKVLGIALLVETMYAVGVDLMVFIALPTLDNVIEVGNEINNAIRHI